MELHIANAKRLALQYLAVRRLRRVIAVLVILVCCAVIYLHLGIFRHRKNTVPSAIGCKSKIAQVATYVLIISEYWQLIPFRLCSVIQLF